MNGCFFTTQSYNHGKLLSPGVSSFTFGIAKRELPIADVNYRSVDTVYYDTSISTNYIDTNKIYDTTIYPYPTWDYIRDTISPTTSVLSGCINYRLGVLSEFPFGNGMDIGFVFEGPVVLNTTAAVSLECTMRLGIKSFRLGSGVVNHNVMAGWLIGQWVDNSYFLEYASGFEIGNFIFYTNYRGILSGTDLIGGNDNLDIIEDTNDGFGLGRFADSNRSWNNRIAIGISIEMPEIAVFPDYLIPEASFIFPTYSHLTNLGINFSLGLQWEFK